MDSPWSMKCHDTRHTGRSPYSTADNPYDEKWKFGGCDWVEGGPVIGNDGTIYFGDFNRDLYALYPNGTLKWKYKTGGWIWSTPAIGNDGSIYIGSWDCGLYSFNSNGVLKWKFGAGQVISSSPAIGEDGTIYFGVMGPDDIGRIWAVNPNGTAKWYYDTGYWIVSDPAIGEDGTIYIGSGDTYLYALHSNGTLKWRFKTGDEIHGHPSIANDGIIYISSYDGYLYALFPNGTLKWKLNIGWKSGASTSIGLDGILYIGLDRLYAFYPNGTLCWSFNLGSNRWIGHSSPAISADGTIYIGTHIGNSGGDVIAVNPDGTERWRKKIANEWVDSSPCIAEDGTVYIGSAYDMGKGFLYAFGRAELQSDISSSNYGLVGEQLQFNGFAEGGYKPYSWHWDFGDSNTSNSQNVIHAYTNSGNYTVTLTVTDDQSNISSATTWALIRDENLPPNKPTINGDTTVNVDESNEYSFKAIDPEGDNVQLYVDWGDGTNTGWLNPVTSGTTIKLSHSWDTKKDYTIKAKAKDVFDDESNWEFLDITVPHQATPLFLKLLERIWDRFPNMFPILKQLLN